MAPWPTVPNVMGLEGCNVDRRGARGDSSKRQGPPVVRETTPPEGEKERRDTITNQGYRTTGLRDTVKRGSALLLGTDVCASLATIVVGKKGELPCDATHLAGSGPYTNRFGWGIFTTHLDFELVGGDYPFDKVAIPGRVEPGDLDSVPIRPVAFAVVSHCNGSSPLNQGGRSDIRFGS